MIVIAIIVMFVIWALVMSALLASEKLAMIARYTFED